MSQLVQRLAAEMQDRCLLLPGQKILVAVSGGVDSVVLLHGLNSLAAQNRWQLSVAHFNHQLRGRASAADEKLVGATAKKLGLKFHVGRGEVKQFAAQTKQSIEMAARKLRHEFLAQVAREQNISTIALAHHADDQVELFFLRLLRGAGGEGLAGMKWVSPSPVDRKLRLIRPLLRFSKTELLDFAAEQRLRFREDASNFSNDHLRNRIRHELLPLLVKNYQPGLAKTVLRVMDIVGAEADFVTEAAQPSRRKSEPAFEKLAVAVQRKKFQQQLAARGELADFNLIEQLRGQPEKFVSVAANLAVACVAGKLIWRERPPEKFKTTKLKVAVDARGATFGGCQFSWSQRALQVGQGWQPAKTKTRSTADFQESFDAAKIGGEIILRHWRAGDRFQPIGLPSAAKLQDLFVNAKVPAARRRRLVLATTADGEIFWVEGLRIADQFKLTPQTKAELRWNCSRLPV